MSSEIASTVSTKVSRFKRFVAWFVGELRWTRRVIISSCDRFYWDNGFSKAAALAYTTLLSLVPVTALGFSFLATFVAKNESIPELRNFIIRLFKQFAPNAQAVGAVDTVIIYITDFTKTIASTSINERAMVFLVITSILLLNSVEYGLNEIWKLFEAGGIPHRIARFGAILWFVP